MNARPIDTAAVAAAEDAEAPPTAPDADEIGQQLARILGSAAFRDSLRLRRFISFVVATALAGKADQIKAYTIAVEALGRGSNFDPQSDPIVRVEACRLRQALARYYDGAGCHDPLLIDLPRGTYVPRFHRRQPDRPLGDDADPRAHANGSARSLRLAELVSKTHQLSQDMAEFRALMEVQREQVAAFAELIRAAQQILDHSLERLDTTRPPVPASLAGPRHR
ncbi:MAG TPA: hypothetical protein VGJ20_08930 [Xanthobacteraceae bacterium]|jgi:hypothetical protein